MKTKIDQLSEAGLFVGHRKSATHPKMKPYISGEKNTIHLIDLEKTAEKLEEMLEKIKKIREEGKNLLLVGTKKQAKDLVKETADECKMPYVNERWLGGTITNFPIIKKRVEYYKDLEKKKAAGELEKYTKKERLEIDREIERLRLKFEGIKNMETTPDAIFVLDIQKDITAVKEAKIKNILIFAIIDTDDNPDLVDCFVPANNDAIVSIKYILDKIKEVLIKTPVAVKSVKTENKEIS
ncbi:MAG: 30S ribosomal protein S2 [Candidatus Pacebacteria bacterium]|nr:30S ribosomal protein S2 [Candidatus Paceibacterota bacterium]MDD3072279.1 30S ribosomal protein S2 [Candidatus Paceibacterota bacterium]MDD3728859.1 30S ribosomal protein S2 [Candidatus Paceibacterota bacterium]MDD4201796.1 30S ribosomal protein S2 [Candidatus Paceibacterota bacterium]MDD4467351.1 30S ribosomal protein S2 [Candidatus Paceibacterota bacterium]